MKKKETIQIIIANIIVIFLIYILHKESNLDYDQITSTSILSIFTINLLFFSYKITKIISIFLIVIIWFFIGIWFLPLYEDTPNEDSFYFTQHKKYIFSWDNKTSEITEISDFWEQKIFPEKTYQQLFLKEEKEKTIWLDTNQNSWSLIIKFPDWTMYIMYSWKIRITQIWNTEKIIKEYWNHEYYQPTNNRKIIIENNNIEERKNKSDFSLPLMIKEYEIKQKQYIIEQGWWKIIMEPIYQRFSKRVLEIVYIIRPEKYINNQKNYETYKKILNRNDINDYKYETEDNRKWLLFDQIKKAQKENRIVK